jgi:hypothetical protein
MFRQITRWIIVQLLPIWPAGLSTHTVHDDIVGTLGLGALSSGGTFYPSSRPFPLLGIARDLNDADNGILAVLTESPFASLRQRARLNHLLLTTVYKCLTQSFRFTAHQLRCVSLYSVKCSKRHSESRFGTIPAPARSSARPGVT